MSAFARELAAKDEEIADLRTQVATAMATADAAFASASAAKDREIARLRERWIDPGLTTALELCAAEAMRAKCEAILQAEITAASSYAALARLCRAKDAIAALKGNGEGSEAPSPKDQH